MLVEEVNPTVDNFGVYIDNYHCDVTDRVSCPRTLIVRHESQEVQLRTVQMLPLKVQVCWRAPQPRRGTHTAPSLGGDWAAPPELGWEGVSAHGTHAALLTGPPGASGTPQPPLS